MCALKIYYRTITDFMILKVKKFRVKSIKTAAEIRQNKTLNERYCGYLGLKPSMLEKRRQPETDIWQAE